VKKEGLTPIIPPDLRLTTKHVVVVLLSASAVAGLVYVRRAYQPAPPPPPEERHTGSVGYADPIACASCHDQIAGTYRLTGMGRSFSALQPDAGGIPGVGSFYHEPSGRYYTMIQRDGTFYQRRHEIGFDGKETNAIEFRADYVIGSGNHARTFLYHDPEGKLIQLPVSWYAGPSTELRAGGYWAMSPGYDRPAHLDFRRVIDAGCVSCHNGYPRGAADPNSPVPSPSRDAPNSPRFSASSLPEGIDCQRCHGPGQSHIEAVNARDLEAARRAIVNPAKLGRERQLDVCMQCHLETTSSPLPFQIRRYEQAPFSYSPGQALGDYFIHFDHAPGSGRDDKFEIAGAAYRLRKSACFERSEMTCVTCHDPHDVPRGTKAVQHYVAVCESCHQSVHPNGAPPVQGVKAGATCLDCHMPKRRTEDAVHVVMTDHFIQSRRALGSLLAARKESENFESGGYRGEVVLYYPPTLAPTSENELYQALAQVQHGSNLPTGIARFEHAIVRHKPERADFYYELARAYAKASNYDGAIRWSEAALERDGNFAPALKELAAAATTTGRLREAAQALEKAVALQPRDGDAFADLGNVYLQQNRVDEAQKALARALALDAAIPRANNTMGLTALKTGAMGAAETHFRAAIRSQPDLAEAHNNLGNVLASRKAYREAAYHFERAIGSDPNYVQAHHSYGVVLALTGELAKAVGELRTALRLSPALAQARLDLADVLATQGRTNDAVREYELAIKTTTDPEVREAARAALRSLKR
jgi:tetratricopeptide (TPR) repeat protein